MKSLRRARDSKIGVIHWVCRQARNRRTWQVDCISNSSELCRKAMETNLIFPSVFNIDAWIQVLRQAPIRLSGELILTRSPGSARNHPCVSIGQRPAMRRGTMQQRNFSSVRHVAYFRSAGESNRHDVGRRQIADYPAFDRCSAGLPMQAGYRAVRNRIMFMDARIFDQGGGNIDRKGEMRFHRKAEPRPARRR